MKIEFVIRPSEDEIKKMFPSEDISVESFLDWLTDNVKEDDAYFKNREICDNHYKNLFINLFTPSYYQFTIRRRTNKFYDFFYAFRCEIEYDLEKFDANMFDFMVLTDASFTFCSISYDMYGKEVRTPFNVRKELIT